MIGADSSAVILTLSLDKMTEAPQETVMPNKANNLIFLFMATLL